MVQKSGDHQLRLVVEVPLFKTGFINPRWLAGFLPPTVFEFWIFVSYTGTSDASESSLVEFDVYSYMNIMIHDINDI